MHDAILETQERIRASRANELDKLCETIADSTDGNSDYPGWESVDDAITMAITASVKNGVQVESYRILEIVEKILLDPREVAWDGEVAWSMIVEELERTY